MEITWEAILAVAGAITIIGGSWLTIRKIQKDAGASKKALSDEILKSAKEELIKKEFELQAKLDKLNTRVETLEESVEKDLHHLKETYNGELKNLANKIEDLRGELKQQHVSVVNLLSKMIDKQ